MKKYNPRADWDLKYSHTRTGYLCFVFQSHKARQGSCCLREVYADTEAEAWDALTPPRW